MQHTPILCVFVFWKANCEGSSRKSQQLNLQSSEPVYTSVGCWMSKEAAQSSKSCAFHSCEMFSWESWSEGMETDPSERPTAMDVEDGFQSMHKHMEELICLL